MSNFGDFYGFSHQRTGAIMLYATKRCSLTDCTLCLYELSCFYPEKAFVLPSCAVRIPEFPCRHSCYSISSCLLSLTDPFRSLAFEDFQVRSCNKSLLLDCYTFASIECSTSCTSSREMLAKAAISSGVFPDDNICLIISRRPSVRPSVRPSSF